MRKRPGKGTPLDVNAHPNIERRQTINAFSSGEDAIHVMWEDDERRAYERDVLHEIARDGCVRGELS